MRLFIDTGSVAEVEEIAFGRLPSQSISSGSAEAPMTSSVSSRMGTPGSYPRNRLAKDPALFGNFLGVAARALRTRM